MASAVPQSCSPRLAWQLRIYFFVPLILSVLLSVLLFRWKGPRTALPFFAAAALLLPALTFYPRQFCEHLRYTRFRDRFCIDRGVLWRQTVLIPSSQIQLVRLRRTPLERMLKISSMTVITPAGSVTLPGLAEGEAERLRMLLEQRTRP